MEDESEIVPVTIWLQRAQEGDADAQQKLWEHYYRQLLGLARAKLSDGGRRVSDEQDVVSRAFESFFRGAEEGRFPRLDDRGDLWQLLVMLTTRKSTDAARHYLRQRRGSGKVRGESFFLHSGKEDGLNAGFDEFEGDEPSPSFALELMEQFERLLHTLDDDLLKKIALRKLEGFRNREIAEELGTTTRTIERKLQVIRSRWSSE